MSLFYFIKNNWSVIYMDNENKNNYIENEAIVKTGFVSSWVFDWTKSIIVALFTVIILLTFVFRIVNVDGPSMNTTLADGEKLFVTSLFYTPENGDIVIINHGQHLDEPIVKRVIATEGQRLRIDFENQKVYVDDKELDEPYVSSEIVQGDADIPEIIPKGKIFVMGDNRRVSLDSRYNRIGLIDTSDVIGKAQFIMYPFEYLY